MSDGAADVFSRPGRCAFHLGSYEALVRREAEALGRAALPKRLWAKDAALWSADQIVQRTIAQRLGWLTVPEAMAGAAAELTAWAGSVTAGGIRDVVLLGMGGSSLCAEVCRQVIGSSEGAPTLTVLDTTDPATILQVERRVDLRRTLFLVASKSGSTIEVDALCRYFTDKVRAVVGQGGGKGAGSHFMAITDPGSPLERQARDEGYLRCFLNPADVGGRFSALSYFGLVPAALIGVPMKEFLERATRMMQWCQGDDVERNPGIWLGLALGALAKAGRDKMTLLPSPALRGFGLWVEQLVAESTGKEGKGVVPVDGEAVGSPDTYGHDRVFVTLELEGESPPAAQLDALGRAGHPVIRIGLRDRLELAGEFFRWEMATAVAGMVLGVNPFDEPNVTESKEHTRRLLDAATGEGRLPDSQAGLIDQGLRLVAPSGRVAGGSLPEAVWNFLKQAGPTDYVALLAYLPQTDTHDAALQAIRNAIHERLRVATTVGYGPRYLHSTGQLHKGGDGRGLFLLITSDEREDAPVPGRAYSFGVLKRAQALGDEAALVQRGRRLLRLHLGADVTADLERAARLITT
ncbi:MAG: glucose-6-phosphate isomerase [Nitrospirae bacterium]|nr:glucose-6-phosphate isomerase [Nitrospirota bacterium]